MSDAVRALEPAEMWNHFADLNAVPRPSKKEERVIAFMRAFGEGLGLPTLVDDVGNVIIKKPASPGMEDRQTVVLQSHLDMVHQKNAATEFDFNQEGIRMRVDGDWVRADGTTLGADNGIGVASIMAILSSDSIAHPPVEALFTIDEETGMTGAMGLEGGLLEGKILLNLDTEDDDELTIGCAGGMDVTANGKYMEQAADDSRTWYKLSLKGLTGGHSGMDIHRGRGNANKLMNRAIAAINEVVDVQISSIDGGGLRNAIPRESSSVIGVHNDEQLRNKVEALQALFKAEYRSTDPNLVLVLEGCKAPQKALTNEFAHDFVRVLAACPVGIWRMSPEIEGLVQTSNNVARVLVEKGQYTVMCLTRSAVDSEKFEEAETIKGLFELIGGKTTFSGSYPGWTPRPDASIVGVMSALYKELFLADAHVMACHAGLECGILGTNYPEMEMISFGPNIRGAHSPDECVQISSVQKYWKLLLTTLQRIPKA
jgi:dipeptidase D